MNQSNRTMTDIKYGLEWLGYLKYQLLYHESIKQCAENTVTVLQMTSACMSLGNFTQEEIIRETINMFILNGSLSG